MSRFALRLSYVGTRFCGWQAQSSRAGKATSIQQAIEESLASIVGKQIRVIGSGRTDAGVHATGQVAHFDLEATKLTPDNFCKGLNSKLPLAIRCLEAWEASPGFHAQRSALRKQYSYYFLLGPVTLPHWDPLTWWSLRPLREDCMSEALSALVGEHDFKAFQSSGSKPGGTTVRKITEAVLTRESLPFPEVEGGHRLLRIRIVGSGFLKQMVRSIVGTLKQIGEGKIPPARMAEILEARDRKLVGPTAPARGLWLEHVWYS